MITCLDDGIGRILESLEKLGLEENTIVVFLSDNGPQMESSRQMQQFRSREWHRMDAMWKGVGRYNANLRGEKATVYEGGIRSPFFARWVGQLPAGKTLDLAASHIDLLPTLLDLCEVPLPEGPALDGRSLAPLLNSPWQKSSRHSTVPASRRTALRFGHILPVCTRIAPCPAGAGTVSVLAGLSPRTDMQPDLAPQCEEVAQWNNPGKLTRENEVPRECLSGLSATTQPMSVSFGPCPPR